MEANPPGGLRLADLMADLPLTAEAARSEADAADAKQRAGEPLPPLHGVPVTIKECINVQGMPSKKLARQVEQGSAGLPVGVQVVARPGADHVALAAMAAIEAQNTQNKSSVGSLTRCGEGGAIS
jgi:Asp-tRNA(Asn)/Glu-tRNA(Gln) amidotransferase A subunit family amidase